MIVEPLSRPDPHWLRMRRALWPDASEAEHLDEVRSFLDEPGRFGQFIARDASGHALGFVEVAIRHDYVNGTESSPVGFLEGIHVEPEARRRGVARALVEAAARWARGKGCAEFATDALLENEASHAVLRRLGFQETERVVCFRRRLAPE